MRVSADPHQTIGGVTASDDDKRNRAQFLLAMYKAMWDNINRHILVVWQSVVALLTAIGATYLTNKDLLDPDIGATLVVIVAAWSIAHTIDSSGWYNRNLLIITNIERQFLFDDDDKNVHLYFTMHRSERPIEHLRIQMVFVVVVALLALVQHFTTRVAPGLGASRHEFQAMRSVPYLVAAVATGALWYFDADIKSKYRDLQGASPGRDVTDGTPLALPRDSSDR